MYVCVTCHVHLQSETHFVEPLDVPGSESNVVMRTHDRMYAKLFLFPVRTISCLPDVSFSPLV